MTENLHAKFATLQDQLAAEHTEIMNALDTIATALGAPPPGPTTTLEDVVTAITAGNTLLTGIRSDQASQATALLAVANALYSNSEIMIQNASTNTQALISAIYATFCDCITATPVLPPPIDVTPTPLLEDEKCKRIQFYISLFTTWLTKIGNYTAAGASLSAGVIDSLLALAATDAGLVATGAEVGAAGGIPGVVALSVVAAIAGAVYLLGSAVVNDRLIEFQSPIFQHALLEALYAATNADEGQSAFESVVGDHFDTVTAGIFSALWWTSWSNDIYSGVPTVDDSAFDGSICAPVDGPCYTMTMQFVTANVGSDAEAHEYAAIWPSAFNPTSSRPDGVRTWSEAVFARLPVGTHLTGRKTSSAGVANVYEYHTDGGVAALATLSTVDQTFTISESSTGLTIQSQSSDPASAAEVVICFVE